MSIILIHWILVSFFLFHYAWKAYLLLTDKKDTLAAYTAKTRIAEMVVALCFFLTGFYMIYAGSAMTTLLWIKVAMVFASIPVAVIGFKRSNKPMAALAILLLVGAYGLAEVNKKHLKEAKVDTSQVTGDPVAVGKAVYSEKCISCHGAAGELNANGVKSLKLTQLSDDQIKTTILNGVPGTGMVGFKAALTDDQLNGLVSYIKTLK
jgi:mono/diheme cytochrome c family protein